MVVLSNANKSTGQWLINQFILFTKTENFTGCYGAEGGARYLLISKSASRLPFAVSRLPFHD